MNWISVKDRLPESVVRVLITDGKDIGFGYFIDESGPDDLIHDPDDYYWQSDRYVDEDKITHWRPLLDPPKEETEPTKIVLTQAGKDILSEGIGLYD